MSSEVTVVCTANGRDNLLKRTLDSFNKFNTYKAEIIVRDDSKDHVGQIKSCDILYSQVKTPYVFHIEEDWEFVKPGFIEDCLEQIEDGVHSVWVRNADDFDGYHRVKPLTDGKYIIPSPISMGFSFNPHLFDMRYYDGFEKMSSGETCPEDCIGRYLLKQNLKTIWIPGYCYHIG